MSSLPNVVHVGFSKCASTFLRSFFSEHPQTFLVSEAHFFAPFERCHYDRGKDYYESLFRESLGGQLRVESDEHIVLPLLHPVLRAAATTIEAVEEASERVKETVPHAKIILVIRNQLDLMLSRYGEYVMSGRDIGFEEFVDEFLCSTTDQVNYFQNYYSKVINILRSDFSDKNVLILLQEELHRDERSNVEQLCRFLDIPILPMDRETSRSLKRFLSLDVFRVVARSGRRSKNTGLSLLGIRIMRLWNRLLVVEPEEAYYKKATARLPYVFYKFGVRAIRVLDYYLPSRLKGNKKTLFTPRVVEKIRKEFGEDNRRLGELLSRKLVPLGYWTTT